MIAILVAGILITGTVAALYAFQYGQEQSSANAYLSELKKVQPSQSTSILFDFGNGTRTWSNFTVPTGTNAYTATVIAAHGVVNSTWYGAPYDEHFVNGIENIQNSAQESWFVWTYNDTAHWQVAQVGVDDLAVANGTIFAWTYCNYNSTTYAPSCSP